MAGAAARVSHRPSRADEGWVELLASGLTFDLTGLAPGRSSPVPSPVHRFGIPASLTLHECEAITLMPGQHIASGVAIMPVVRAMVGLAANIALPLSVEAICWHPSQSFMEPQYFARVVLNWLSGEAFPALGLTAIEETDQGGFVSKGLAFFIGQEIQLEPLAGESSAEAVKLAVRLIDYMVRNGPLREPRELEGPNGERMLAEPSHHGKLIWIWRGV